MLELFISLKKLKMKNFTLKIILKTYFFINNNKFYLSRRILNYNFIFLRIFIPSIWFTILNLNTTKVFKFLKSFEKFDFPPQKLENHSKISCFPFSIILKFKNFILLFRSKSFQIPSPLPFTGLKDNTNKPIIELFYV